MAALVGVAGRWIAGTVLSVVAVIAVADGDLCTGDWWGKAQYTVRQAWRGIALATHSGDSASRYLNAAGPLETGNDGWAAGKALVAAADGAQVEIYGQLGAAGACRGKVAGKGGMQLSAIG